MSTGQGFDPSLLEGKDRSELVAIAEQLGEKPPARAKKADIVALIARLVGAADEGAADEGAPDASAASDTPEPGSGEGADDAAGAPEDEDGAGDAADEHDDAEEPAAEEGSGAPDAPDAGTGADRNQGARQGNQGNGNQGNGNQGQGNQGQGQNNQGNQNGEAGEGDDVEPGNRRRRRRGRDRNRTEDEVVQADPVPVEGLVDLREEGYGFLRVKGYLPSRDDSYISVKQARQFGLRRGDHLTGRSRPANRNEKNPALLQIDTVNGHPAHQQPARARFDELTPLFPDERLRMELPNDPGNMTTRIIDLLAPIGKGQRGLIVSPPKAGKTTIMKEIVRSIETNHPEVHLIVLLVDERPEEVTDFIRWVQRGEVAAATFDRPSEEHIALAELVIERAKRLVENGQDVCIVLDGITRLARAYNLAAPAGGRVMAGGIDTTALFPPKRFFGAARNVEEGGSLTILATALVETNTRMDEVIFEEFKGTGNMELKLDRGLAERRIFPAIDVDASSTRHEELLFDRKALEQVWKLRRVLAGLKGDSGSNAAGIEMLTDRLASFRTNEAFLAEVAKGPGA